MWSSSPFSSSSGNHYYVRLDITAGNQTILYDARNHAYSLRCVKAGLPLAQTGSATDITAISATLTGLANGNGSSATVSFGWGTGFTHEHTVQAIPNIISGNSPENITYTLTGLYPNQIYYYRIQAVSSTGTVYGLDRSFKTLPAK
jgi:phosphodiesterase/alkaline phosphatase D-like protein